MKVTVAKHAGFCFGVKRATDRLETAIREKQKGERIYTLGTLIHNDVYNRMLEEQGVRVVSIDEVKALAENAPSRVKPKWLDFNEQDLAAKVVALPAREDIDFDFEEQLIVELYSK